MHYLKVATHIKCLPLIGDIISEHIQHDIIPEHIQHDIISEQLHVAQTVFDNAI